LMEGRYDLWASRRSVRELYPVLLDAHGNVIDGFHRLRVDPGWRTETLGHVRTPTQLVLARIIANTHRRSVSREEREEQVNEIARCLSENEGVPGEEILSTIADLTTFTERYIRGLLSSEYKRGYTAPDNSELSSEYEKLAKESDEAVLEDDVEDVDASESDIEETPAEEYVAEYFSRYLKPDEDFLAWDLGRRFGLSESEAMGLIEDFKDRRKMRPTSRGTVVRRDSPLTCACPLCGRSGANRNLILLKTEDPELAQLPLGDFVKGALGGVRAMSSTSGGNTAGSWGR
jgi:hypothetical protein